jgi:squalene-hopene/tetraprenyl-beta-curcumene cyclase
MADADFDLALGLLDGLRHWRRDAANGRPSRVLARVVGEGVQPAPEDVERIAREIYYGGHAVAVLHEVTAALDRALVRTTERARVAEIATLRRHCEATRTDLAAMMERNRRVAAARSAPRLPPSTGDRAFDLARDAAVYVVEQWRLGFGELAHHSRFRPGLSREIVSGDVFQRALVADALCDMPAPWPDELADVLAGELAYIHKLRRCPMRGWSYYPELDELPPDADSLGQILQVTLLLGRRDLAPSFDEPIRQALCVGAFGDGSFSTWILPPPAERTPLHERQSALVGGPSADAEIVSNLAYALMLLDRCRFKDELATAARWVAAQQQPSGEWTAKWYLGRAYSTYACTRFLAAFGGYPATLEITRRGLLDMQREDGGWGRDGDESNALDTAHALLALEAIGDTAAVQSAFGAALDYLAGFAPDRWPRVPFLPLTLSDPRPLASRTITAAYAAKAIARCRAHG